MNIKDILDKYEIKKIGLISNNDVMCNCGNKLTINDKCSCGNELKKSKLLNVNKNTALGKRYETIIDNDVYSFIYYQLLSNGFELYEIEMLNFEVNKKTCDVKISNSKTFKTIDKSDKFNNFLATHFNGLIEYIYSCLNEFEHGYAIRNLTSLSESQLSNFINVYINYKALTPFLRGYKVFYYGSNVNIKKYYPEVDFNLIEDVDKCGLNYKLLPSWDIKNEKYIESIIDISKENSNTQRILEDILISMLNENDSVESFDNTINSFGLLYNKEISLSDFIRIYNNSRNNTFNNLYEFRKLHKKFISKTIDWSEIEKIDRKTIGKLKTKEYLKKDIKISNKEVDKSFELLEKDPLLAIKYLTQFDRKSY